MTTNITFYLLGIIIGWIIGWVLLKRPEWVTTFFNWVKSLFG